MSHQNSFPMLVKNWCPPFCQTYTFPPIAWNMHSLWLWCHVWRLYIRSVCRGDQGFWWTAQPLGIRLENDPPVNSEISSVLWNWPTTVSPGLVICMMECRKFDFSFYSSHFNCTSISIWQKQPWSKSQPFWQMNVTGGLHQPYDINVTLSGLKE